MNEVSKRICCIAALALAATLTGTSAQAEDRKSDTKSRVQQSFPAVKKTMNRSEFKPSVGVSAGITTPEASFKTSAEYGINAAMQVWTPLGLGLDVTGLSTSRSYGGESQSLNRTNVLLVGSYHLGGDIPALQYTYFGLGLGAVFDTNAYRGAHTGIAPIAGIDIPLNDQELKSLSLGLSAKYVFVSGPSPDSFAINGVAKYWF